MSVSPLLDVYQRPLLNRERTGTDKFVIDGAEWERISQRAGDPFNENVGFYNLLTGNISIYLGDLGERDIIPKVICLYNHEILHRALHETEGLEACIRFDNIGTRELNLIGIVKESGGDK